MCLSIRNANKHIPTFWKQIPFMLGNYQYIKPYSLYSNLKYMYACIFHRAERSSNCFWLNRFLTDWPTISLVKAQCEMYCFVFRIGDLTVTREIISFSLCIIPCKMLDHVCVLAPNPFSLEPLLLLVNVLVYMMRIGIS